MLKDEKIKFTYYGDDPAIGFYDGKDDYTYIVFLEKDLISEIDEKDYYIAEVDAKGELYYEGLHTTYYTGILLMYNIDEKLYEDVTMKYGYSNKIEIDLINHIEEYLIKNYIYKSKITINIYKKGYLRISLENMHLNDRIIDISNQIKNMIDEYYKTKKEEKRLTKKQQ